MRNSVALLATVVLAVFCGSAWADGTAAEFTVVPVPEPSALIGVGTGVGVLGLLRFLRKK